MTFTVCADHPEDEREEACSPCITAIMQSLTLADELAAAVRDHAHAQHRGMTGAFDQCVAEECDAARAYTAAREGR